MEDEDRNKPGASLKDHQEACCPCASSLPTFQATQEGIRLRRAKGSPTVLSNLFKRKQEWCFHSQIYITLRGRCRCRCLQPPLAPPITHCCCQPCVPSAFPSPFPPSLCLIASRSSRASPCPCHPRASPCPAICGHPPASHAVHAQSPPQICDSRSRPCLSFPVSRIIIYKNSHKIKRPPLPIAGMSPPHAHSGETPFWSPASQLSASPSTCGVPGKGRERPTAAITPTGQQRAPSPPLTDGRELPTRLPARLPAVCVVPASGELRLPGKDNIHSPGHPGTPETETAPHPRGEIRVYRDTGRRP
jgi:hypothetical protein